MSSCSISRLLELRRPPQMTSTIGLEANEEIVLDYLPSAPGTRDLYVVTLGLWAIWRRRHRFIVTNMRVIVSRGVATTTQCSVPISTIVDMRLSSSAIAGYIYVVLLGADGPLNIERVGPLSEGAARRFVDTISRQRGPSG